MFSNINDDIFSIKLSIFSFQKINYEIDMLAIYSAESDSKVEITQERYPSYKGRGHQDNKKLFMLTVKSKVIGKSEALSLELEPTIEIIIEANDENQNLDTLKEFTDRHQEEIYTVFGNQTNEAISKLKEITFLTIDQDMYVINL